MMSQGGKPHTSSGHMITNTIKVHSNCVLLTSNLFNTRGNARLSLCTWIHQIEEYWNSGVIPKRQNNLVTDLPDLRDSL